MSTAQFLNSGEAFGFTADVPAVDHHSHASYVRPGQQPASFLESARGLHYVESRMPHEAFNELVQAKQRGDIETQERLSSQYDVEALIDRHITFRSTTLAASAMLEGARALYGDLSVAELAEKSKQWRAEDPVGLYDRALVLANTPVILTDVPTIDSSMWPSERYKPIARLDPYFYPFGHPEWVGRGKGGHDLPHFRAIFSWVLDGQLRTAGLEKPPADLDDYLAFAVESIRRRHSEGFVGFKIASAYVRPLTFAPVDYLDAKAAYSALQRAGGVEPAAYTQVADFMAFELASVAAELGAPLQIHTGIGPHPLSNAHPLNLETFIESPRLSTLKIVLIHGGFPFSSYLTALSAAHGNVYVDFSMMPHMQYRTLERLLEEWLEYLPADKVIFGTDTEDPEHHVAGTWRVRRLLDRVLSRGVGEGLWTVKQGSWLAERVLHQNLCDLYGITLP